jgi:hypothetical protein
MMQRILISITLSVALFAPALLAASDPKSNFGIERASLLEALIPVIYPGTHLEWQPQLAIVQGGQRRLVRIGGMDVRTDATAYVGAVALQYPDTVGGIGAALSRYEPAGGQSLPEIIAFTATKQFAITAVHRGSLGDPSSALAEVSEVEFTSLTYDNAWPDVFVTYRGTYGTSDWVGEIKWESRMTTDPVAMATRLPQTITRVDKAGTTHNDSALNDMTPASADVITISSRSSHQLITTCNDPCLPDGRTLLGLWWSVSTVAATP